MATINCFVTSILQSVIFYVQQNKNSYMFGTTWEWVNNDRIVNYLF